LAIKIEIPNKEEKLKKLNSLIQKFANNIQEYKNPNYNEANLRLEFLNPFFELLGWDVRNEQNFHINYKDVLVEERIDVYGSSKAPDYTFRIGGQTKFYIEAKKPSVDIKGSQDAAFQVKRYGHSAKLSISVLTDFEEFSIYDTRKTPHKNDKPIKNRIAYYTYNQYIEKFDEIYNFLSKQAILQGSFEQFEKDDKYKKGNETVDEGILELVSNFREKLAKNIAKNNKNIDVYSLNKAVIKIIDRILFLRIAEDKNIEKYKALLDIAEQQNIYKNLKKFFVQADERYNSELFKYFKQIDDLIIEDKILKEIITALYEDCPYEFSVIPVSILGSMYEQFLGKTIHITPGNLVKIEDKPEVKKAGGVYYTPEYIVNYIVENTVGEKIKGLTPKQIEKIKILDPACGSGSFLIGAYQYLLNYHLNYYLKEENFNSAKKQKLIKQTKDGFILSIPEKQRILTNNIFGVDIDQQAVEVAKFSLMLKLMETEKKDLQDLIPYAQMYSDIKMLPNLNKNIQCGNSLIGTDYYTNADMALIDQEQIQKINPFDWQKQFSEIFKQGGFDCVIGNPPYIRYENINQETIEYSNKYKTAVGCFDIFQLFLEKAYILTKETGFFSFIFPNLFLKGVNYKISREFFYKNSCINIIRDYGDNVFIKVKMPTCIVVFNKRKMNDTQVVKYYKKQNDNFKLNILKQQNFNNKEYTYSYTNCFDKVYNEFNKLEHIVNITRGIEIGKNKIIAKKTNCVPIIFGENISRYIIKTNSFIARETFEQFKKNDNIFKTEKLIIRETGNRITVTYDNSGFYTNRSIYCIRSNKINLKFLLAVLNSNFIQNFYVNFFKSNTNIFPKIRIQQVKQLPIPIIDLTNKEQKDKHDNLVKLVDKMLQVQQKINSAKTDTEKQSFQKIANSIDDQIDKIVYSLYNLTEEEIKIIENNN